MNELQRASRQELAEIFQIFIEAKQQMDRRKIYQWTDTYPSLEILAKDIEKKELLVLKDNTEKIVSAGVLSNESQSNVSKEYQGIRTIQRLVARPSQAGQGFGRQWINSCLEQQCDEGETLLSITNHTNLPMQRLFAKTGFLKVGETTIEGREAFGPFYIFKRNR